MGLLGFISQFEVNGSRIVENSIIVFEAQGQVNKYFGTNATGEVGVFDLTGGGGSGDIAAHIAEADPHEQYLTEVAAAAAYQALSVNLTDISGLSDPGGDRLLYWSDSFNEFRFLQIGTNLTISSEILNTNGTTSASTIADNRIVKGDGGSWGLQQTGITVDDFDAITGALSITLSNTGGVKILDSDSSNTLTIKTASDLTGNRVLNLNTGDANRDLTLTGNFSMSGNFNLTLTIVADTNITLPITGTISTLAGIETLINKTIDLASNTLTGNISQFNAALSGADFATLAGSEALTNKTIDSSIIGGTTPAAGTFTTGQFTGNVIIDGDLLVSGDAFEVNTISVVVEDPLIKLAKNNTASDALDIGLYGVYNPSGTDLYTGFFRDATDGKWKLFHGSQSEPTTTVNLAGIGYTASTLVLGTLEVTDAPTTRTNLGLTIGTHVQAFDADLSAIAALASTGFAVRSVSNTWVQRSITVGSSKLAITNPAGIAGDVIIDIGTLTAADLPALNGLTDADWSLADRIPFYSVSPAANRDGLIANLSGLTRLEPGGRLTLESGVPISYTDQANKTTIYYTPYIHDLICLWDGIRWALFQFTERNFSLGTVIAGRPYDIFIYNNAGTITLEHLAWTNLITRATAVTYQDGRLCKSGDKTRLYLGTYCPGSTTTVSDIEASHRMLWNHYHRVQRTILIIESTDSWTYTNTAWREVNANTANRINLVIGQPDAFLYLTAALGYSNSTANTPARTGIGEDITTQNDANLKFRNDVALANAQVLTTSILGRYAPIGYHFYSWTERSSATGTYTMFGDGGVPDALQSGMIGWVMG